MSINNGSFLQFIKNDNAAYGFKLLPFSYKTAKFQISEKRERRMVLPSHGVVAKTAWRGIRSSSVLKSSACKFSEEKTNQIVVTLCKCICLESLIFA